MYVYVGNVFRVWDSRNAEKRDEKDVDSRLISRMNLVQFRDNSHFSCNIFVRAYIHTRIRINFRKIDISSGNVRGTLFSQKFT